MLPLRCSRPSISFSKSTSFWPSTIARRRSSGCVALISMRFIQSPLNVPQSGLARGGTASTGRTPCGARPTTMQEKRWRNPWLESPWTAWLAGPTGLRRSAALARACQRSACVSCGVDPGRRIVSGGHAATQAAAAWRREQRSGMGAGDGGQHASWRRWTRGARPACGPSCTRKFSGAPQGWVLVACLVPPATWPPGHLGTTAHRGRIGIASPAHGPPRGPCGLTFGPGVRRVNSGKSSTYGSIVDRRIIGGKGRSTCSCCLARGSGGRAPTVKPVTPAAPQVQHLTVDESSAGQRLDNFLMRCLKGVPKTHVYRVIRSGEVRVNKGRAAADTRVQTGDDVRVPPVRVAERPSAAAVPAREFERAVRGRLPAGHRQAGRRGGAWRQRRQLRRHRAAAPRAARGQVPGAGAPPRPGNLRRAAAGQEAQRADGAAGPVPRPRHRQDLCRRWCWARGRSR